MRRVAVPALLLVVLLVAYATRWHVVANKTDQYGGHQVGPRPLDG